MQDNGLSAVARRWPLAVKREVAWGVPVVQKPRSTARDRLRVELCGSHRLQRRLQRGSQKTRNTA